jgi:hypothetical protein
MNEFKLIVAGGRDFNDYGLLSHHIDLLAHGIYTDKAISIVCGMARGADMLGHRFAKQHRVVVHEFPANWTAYGKRAGFMRNQDMCDFGDGLLAFWDGKSKGTAHMIDCINKAGKPAHIVRY